MPKLKFARLAIIPLCLKFRGRIVGAVSRPRLGIYVASGLLMLSCILLIIILVSMKSDPGTVMQSEQQIEQQVSALVPKENVIAPVQPDPIPERTALVISKSMKGPIAVDFGWQFHQVYHDWRYHTGIDINSPIGQAVEAIDKGQVVDIIRDPQSGLTVVIKNDRWTIYYGSLSTIAVSKDSYIRSGQIIGAIGSCDAEPYPHLHLTIKKDEQYIDPKLVISAKNEEMATN